MGHDDRRLPSGCGNDNLAVVFLEFGPSDARSTRQLSDLPDLPSLVKGAVEGAGLAFAAGHASVCSHPHGTVSIYTPLA
eukprot:5916483-Prymnesium_polylepis.1